MPMPRHVLAIDTAAAHCAAAFIRDGQPVATRFEEMARGQAERLMPMLAELLAEAGCSFADIDALAVGIGPGNFTGVRIAVAAARGLALGLGVPVIGISNFELLLPEDETADLLLSLPAPRGQAYLQIRSGGLAVGQPVTVDPAEALPDDLDLPAGCRIIGHQAALLGARLGLPATERELDDVAGRLAARAAIRFARPLDGVAPAPLYVRPPDAAPPSDPPPVILDA